MGIRPLLALALFSFLAAVSAEEGWVTHNVALSPDLASVVRGRMHAEEGTSRLRILDAKSGKVRLELASQGPIRAFAFRGDSKRFVATNDHGPLTIQETATGKVVGQLKGHNGWVYSVAYAGGRIASAGRDETIRVWDAAKQSELWRKEKWSAGRVALSPDGSTLATTTRSGKVHLWDAATGKERRVLDTGEGRWGFVVAFSGDGKRLAAGNRRMCVFDVETGKRVAAIEAHDKALTEIALSPDGALLATADRDRRVRVWTVKSGKEARSWTSEMSVGALVFSAKAERLGAATYYGGCQFFRLAEPASGN